MSHVRTILAKMPAADGVPRRPAAVIQVPEAWRHGGRCRGGFGPPRCSESGKRFADAALEGFRRHRAFRTAQSVSLGAALRR